MLSRTLPRLVRRIPTSRSIISFATSTPVRLSSPSLSQRYLSTSHPRLATTPMAAPTDTQAEEVQNSTGITPDTLTQTLKSSSLSPTHVDIQDISGGCGASFAAMIVSDEFKGKSALQRHRLVNGLLKDEIKAIHAWTPR